MKDMTDSATYERLEKDVTAVKNDIAALTDQITDALNTFAGSRDRSKHAAATRRRASTWIPHWTTPPTAAARC